jgi:uncharacterized membrane protein
MWNGSACQYTGMRGVNSTPWQSDVDSAESALNACLIALTIAGIMAMIGAYWKNILCSCWVGWIFLGLAIISIIVAMMKAFAMITAGETINAKGGKPLGDYYKTMGYICLFGALAAAIATFWANTNLLTPLSGVIIGTLVIALPILSALLVPKGDSPAPIHMDTPEMISCPAGEQPVDPNNPDAGCQPIPSNNSSQ